MQAQSVEEGREPLHDQQNGHCQGGKSSKDEEEAQASSQAPHAEANVDHHGPEHLRELCREKGEKTRVSRNRELFTYKAKTEVKQTPATMRWKLKRDKSFHSQVCQDIASSCHTGRAESLLSSSLLYSVILTPLLPFSRAVGADPGAWSSLLPGNAHAAPSCTTRALRGLLCSCLPPARAEQAQDPELSSLRDTHVRGPS